MKINNKKGVAGISTAVKVLMSVVLGGLVLLSVYGIINQQLKENYKKTHILQANETDKGITELVQEQETEIQLGDVNKDKKTDYGDLIYLQHFLAGWNGYSVELKYGDINRDGIINEADGWALEDLLDSMTLGDYDDNAKEFNPGKNNKVLPSGATYYRGANKLSKFPDMPANNDVFVYQDYKYVYNSVCSGHSDITKDTWTSTNMGGWGVRILTQSKKAYSPIMTSIDNKPVISADYTFYYCKNLKTPPVIPISVKSMNYTFAECAALEKMSNIPAGVTALNRTFSNCVNLTKLRTIPDNVSILSYTFENCSGIIFVPNLPKNLTTLSGTFAGCASLKAVPDIPNTVKSMEYAFYHCSSLIRSPQLSNKTWDMSYAFTNCISLVAAPKLPDAVLEMQDAFRGCKSIKQLPALPPSVLTLNNTFADCALCKVDCIIPSNVREMRGTFKGCTSLSGTITIKAKPPHYTEPTNYENCFFDTFETINLIQGDSVDDNIITALMSSANNGNVYCNEFIPRGAEYITKKDGKLPVYNRMPATTQEGDKFIYKDYEYEYATIQNQHGWKVRARENKERYGEILRTINNEPIISMQYAFLMQDKLVEAPKIPDTVVDMEIAFLGCSALKTAPELPSSVRNMSMTFCNCHSLTGTISINSNFTNYDRCFYDTKKPITLLQSADVRPETIKNLILTANEGNVHCKGY